ncbi:hypothetical protein CLUG_05026 [Clavispora lusitaniae ATCC 42720]|uniref:Uncharacterized protein n=1 Tax=Clavispora lusitaniae (strain ATCC 42720) TaxID=306902 RepID=C4YA88_CLAL4|nr:uncharacterized protein CLUG_05026 [Clavispora lusitaniae ATCC 42720]EEQ40898.1 hypothetical protein CLUG_05026 [Clavispora lusitaniae ATCC 42720]
MMSAHRRAANVNSRSSWRKAVSESATSTHFSKSPGVQNKYSVTPKKIRNSGVEQIIWSYGTMPKRCQLSTMAKSRRCELGWAHPGGSLLKEKRSSNASSSNRRPGSEAKTYFFAVWSRSSSSSRRPWIINVKRSVASCAYWSTWSWAAGLVMARPA